MNNTPIETIGLKSLLMSNLTNPKFNLSENQIHWITHLMMSSMDIHIHIQPYQNKKIEICEIPELIRIYSQLLCDTSNQLLMFDLNHIIKFISFLIDVLVCNKILIVNGSICHEQISKLVVNCLALLYTSIAEKKRHKTFSEQFANTYMDFIKVLTEPLHI